MDRRTLLAAVGTTALAPATAGCAALLGTSNCEPADDPLGDVDASRPVEADVEYRFRGTVVRYLDEGVLIDDGTGKAHVVPGAAKGRINRDLVEVGGCVGGRGSIDAERTRASGMPVLVAQRANFEAIGDSTVDPPELNEVPDPSFESDRQGDDVLVAVIDGGGAAAGNVFFAYDAEAHAWSDLGAETAADDVLQRGMSVTVERPDGDRVDVQWRSPDRTWARRVAQMGV